ncbi:MAG: hypothetical protein ABEJ05_12950 [Haloglomus sp.]
MLRRSRRVVRLFALVLAILLAGCGAAGTETVSPTATLTPAPVPTTAPADAGQTPTPGGDGSVYAIGPTKPLCPSDLGESSGDYPEIVSRRVTVSDTWSNAREAAHLAERATTRVALGGSDPEMAAVPGPPRAVSIAGRTFDPASEFDVDRYAVATTTTAPPVDAIVLEPAGGRTTVQLYMLTGFC